MTANIPASPEAIGIPVRAVNWVHLHPGTDADGAPCVMAVMGQESAPLFALRINPDDGSLVQCAAGPDQANFPTATCLSRDGRLYIGAAHAGHLLRFDPALDAIEDLGPIHSEAAIFPCRIDEDSNGHLWIGSYGTADLSCYDPQNDSFTRYGRMSDTDMYNYPFVAPDGSIACLIRVTQPHVVRFDPQDGSKRLIGPVSIQGRDRFDLLRGQDNELYIDSSLGKFRLEGDQAVAVDQIPPPPTPPPLADGRTFRMADAAEQTHRHLEINSPDGSSRTFELGYQAGGSRIFYLHAGPDQCLYGSSILPLHLFRHNPKDGELIDLGRCSSATGEAYSMANHQGRLFISSYPQAKISVYDPSQGYHYGEEPGANPRDLGRIDTISYRPRSTLAGPLGRVWTASLPDYGQWGGPLSWYDPEHDEKGAYYRICGDASCYTLAWLEQLGLLAVGTSIHGGTGTEPKVDRAQLFLWDYAQEEIIWEGSPDQAPSVFNALVTAPDGRVYGTFWAETDGLFCFDPQQRTFSELDPPPGRPLDLGLQIGPDGLVYGFTANGLYRFSPGATTWEQILHPEVPIQVAGPILDGDIYFSSNHRLYKARLF
jgi:hypothetical protein